MKDRKCCTIYSDYYLEIETNCLPNYSEPTILVSDTTKFGFGNDFCQRDGINGDRQVRFPRTRSYTIFAARIPFYILNTKTGIEASSVSVNRPM